MIFCILVVITIGCISTIYYHIQPNFAGVWRDCFAILKLPLCFYIYSNYTTEQIKEEALKSSAKFSRIFIFILFICAIINLFAPVFNRNGVRYGFQMFGFFYTHNTFLIASVVAMMCILSADGIIKNKKHLIFSIIILILTFRSKAMPIAFLMVLILIIRKRKFQPVEKSKLWLMGIVAAFAAIYISMNRIEEYVNYADSAARGAFYINGIDIANKYFPLGSGFCTFASTLSGKYYSPLYHSYNMSSIWGITKEDTSYAGDTFGQTYMHSMDTSD